jgi:hypothetical protein
MASEQETPSPNTACKRRPVIRTIHDSSALTVTRAKSTLATLLLGLSAFSAGALAFDFPLQDEVLMTDIDMAASGNEGRLGSAVAIGNDVVVMGAPEKSGGGATYGYRITPGRQLQFVREYTAAAASPSRYGGTLVIDKDLLAVANFSDDDPIEIYQRSGNDFVLLKVIEPPTIEGVTIRTFGQAMDLEDGFLIVGDPTANVDGVGNAGIALVFSQNAGGQNNWGLEGVLTNPTGQGSFGKTVAVGRTIAVVGDPADERAVLYERGDPVAWDFSRFLLPVNPQDDDSFGSTVAAEGDIVAVGATNGNNAVQPSNSGSVHIFSRNAGGPGQFGQVAEVVGSQAEFIDEFGASMRIRQGVLAVGSPGANRAYLFAIDRSVNMWREVAVVEPPAVPYFNANFGSAVDYWRGSFVVGARTWNDISSNRTGAVFLFENELVRRCGGFNVVFCDYFEGP